jgi:hypothetical protein
MTNPIESPFEKLLVALVRDGVAFTTVGGIAVCLNGFVRLTEDVDILVESSPRNLDALLQSLARFGEGYARELSREDFTDEEGAVRVVEEAENCQVDIFTVMGGQRWLDLQAHVRYFETQGVRIPYLDAAGLLQLKRTSHREKDRIDVEVLERIARDQRG